jgi:hypothetical protein
MYPANKNTLDTLDTLNMSLSFSSSVVPLIDVSLITLGSVKLNTLNNNKPAFNCAPFLLCVCSLYFNPPKKKLAPNTSSVFVNIDPSKLSFTNRVSPFLNAIKETISSVTFPNVAFNNPPNVSFVCAATSSVTNPRRSAKGTIANTEKKKIGPGDMFPPEWPNASAIGTNKSKMQIFVENKTTFTLLANSMPTFTPDCAYAFGLRGDRKLDSSSSISSSPFSPLLRSLFPPLLLFALNNCSEDTFKACSTFVFVSETFWCSIPR